MDYSVRLDRLPEEVVFPDELRDRIVFDPDRKTLVFRGFMCERTFDSLRASSTDFHYRRALEELFVATSQELRPARAIHSGKRVAIGIVLLLSLIGFLLFFAWRSAGRAGPEANQRVEMPTR